MSAGLIIRDGTNTARTISELVIRDGANTPRTISELRVRDSNNVSRVVFRTGVPLSATADPSAVSGFGSTSTLVTGQTTVTPAGGVAPYSYAWTLQTYDNSVPPTVSSPTSATVTFTQTSIQVGENPTSEWQCTVTDDLGATFPVTVFAFWSRI